MIIGIYGYSKSGKTMLIEKLVPKLVKKGYKVATIKHIFKKDFSIDEKGKDTERHAKAGASVVVASAVSETGIIIKRNMSLKKIIENLKKIEKPDVILVEGFKKANIPKISIGKIKKEKNTVFSYMKYNESIDEILKFIENGIKKGKILSKLPLLNCKKCGFTCVEFANLVFEKKRKINECKNYSRTKVYFEADKRWIPLNKFAQTLISKTIFGMASALKGVGKKKNIIIKLQR
ncbi:MAG: molybdopterin-guanine dinucleotide biosynthesis protein B [Candidatus Thermoplasmatota archaeon]